MLLLYIVAKKSTVDIILPSLDLHATTIPGLCLMMKTVSFARLCLEVILALSVEVWSSADLNQLFGQTDSTVGRGNAESGYILFYQQVDKSELDLFNFDLASLETRYGFSLTRIINTPLQ